MTPHSEAVLRYRDGRIETAVLTAIDPSADALTVTRGSTTAEIPYSEMKAIFFPRTSSEDSVEEPAGSLISVEFIDGEVIRGVAQLNPEKKGFFLFPIDRSKNDRIFVVTSAINSIEVERL